MKRQEQMVGQYGMEHWVVYFEDETDRPLTNQQYDEIQETISKLILKFKDENNTKI